MNRCVATAFRTGVLSILLLTALAEPGSGQSLGNDLHRLEQYRVIARSATPADRVPPLTRTDARSTRLLASVTSVLVRGAITGYQTLLSSQDSAPCNFTPSCSRYARIAISTHGPLVGTLMSSDRLQRCIALARARYPLDPATWLAIDPVPEAGRATTGVDAPDSVHSADPP